MDFLLTNDDSHDSPLFPYTIEKLSAMGKVTVVAPKEEQSWSAKSMNRFRPLSLEKLESRVFCLDGSPADCANVGIYHLFEEKPDMVVSGINMGINMGLGFVLSSGTVGACLEANIAGVPAVALSQELDGQVFVRWLEERKISERELDRIYRQSDEIVNRVFQVLFGRKDFWVDAVTWNVNLPSFLADDWKLIPTFLGHTYYGSCFREVEGRLRHNIDPPVRDTREGADNVIVNQGHVSLTRLDIRTFGGGADRKEMADE